MEGNIKTDHQDSIAGPESGMKSMVILDFDGNFDGKFDGEKAHFDGQFDSTRADSDGKEIPK